MTVFKAAKPQAHLIVPWQMGWEQCGRFLQWNSMQCSLKKEGDPPCPHYSRGSVEGFMLSRAKSPTEFI